jgi:hypothetical protein
MAHRRQTRVTAGVESIKTPSKSNRTPLQRISVILALCNPAFGEAMQKLETQALDRFTFVYCTMPF